LREKICTNWDEIVFIFLAALTEPMEEKSTVRGREMRRKEGRRRVSGIIDVLSLSLSLSLCKENEGGCVGAGFGGVSWPPKRIGSGKEDRERRRLLTR
jgi:hypothetical protein